MKKLEEVINYVKDGSVLLIKRSTLEEEEYFSYIIKYDGGVFKDVILAEINEVISEIPNITEQLNLGNSFCVLYSVENKQYRSSVISNIENSKNKKLFEEKIIQGFQVSSEDFLGSIIDLDGKIANMPSDKIMKKELIS